MPRRTVFNKSNFTFYSFSRTPKGSTCTPRIEKRCSSVAVLKHEESTAVNSDAKERRHRGGRNLSFRGKDKKSLVRRRVYNRSYTTHTLCLHPRAAHPRSRSDGNQGGKRAKQLLLSALSLPVIHQNGSRHNNNNTT